MDLDSLESNQGLLKSENLRIDLLQKAFGGLVNMDEGYIPKKKEEAVGGAGAGVAPAGGAGKKKEEVGKKEEGKKEDGGKKDDGGKKEEGGGVVGGEREEREGELGDLVEEERKVLKVKEEQEMLVRYKQRKLLSAEIANMAFEWELVDLAVKSCEFVVADTWETRNASEMILVQVKLFNINLILILNDDMPYYLLI